MTCGANKLWPLILVELELRFPNYSSTNILFFFQVSLFVRNQDLFRNYSCSFLVT